MVDDRAKTGGRIGATETTFDIVEQIQEAGSLGVSAVADEVGVSKSTAHNHLQTLHQRGYVVKHGDEYRLGLQFLQLGDSARQHHGLFHVAKDEVDSLVEEVGERGQLMVEEHGTGIYIHQSLADQAVQTDSHIGTTVKLHATAVGKAYLAFLPADRRAEILDQSDLTAVTPNTETDRDELEAELETISERGYAFNDEERTIGMRAVGAPVLSDDEVVGGISISGPTTRLSGDWYREEVPELVGRAARVIGIKATYS
ncbi:IclR family transcriptional regulator [Halobacteriales archaeon Cl-PHB]